MNNDLSTHVPPFSFSITRTWSSFAGVGTTMYWKDMETARGTYVWTCFDSFVTSANTTHGWDIIFTFGSTPSWANGGAGVAAPPSNLQDLFDFATAVATRAAGKITYWEPWNEISDSSYWTGTAAQAVAVTRGVGSAVKAVMSSAVILSPPVTWQNGWGWMEAFLVAGGGTYCDAMNYHAYPVVENSPGTPPEQVWNVLSTYTALFTYYGVNTKPLIITEGSWLSNVYVGTTTLQVAYAAIYQALLYSAGVQRQCWFQYDNSDSPEFSGRLWNGSSGLNTAGVAYQQMNNWLWGSTFTSPIARVALTNQLTNPTGTGMVVGTPGTAPTGWSVYNPDSSFGVSTQFVGSGTEAGIAYVDFRVFGTATAGATGQVILYTDAGAIVAATNDTWTTGAYVKRQAGSLSGINSANLTTGISIGFNGMNAGSVLQYNIGICPIYPTPASLNLGLNQFAGKITTASVTKIQTWLQIVGYSVGTAFDVTLRVGLPFADKGSIWQGDLTMAGGYPARMVWDAATTPTSYTTSYTKAFDLTGAVTAISGTATLTNNQPVLLANH